MRHRLTVPGLILGFVVVGVVLERLGTEGDFLDIGDRLAIGKEALSSSESSSI